jgi:hypothetical protein
MNRFRVGVGNPALAARPTVHAQTLVSLSRLLQSHACFAAWFGLYVKGRCGPR